MDAAHGPGLARAHTQLTHKNATAVGVVMAFQFGPQVLLLPLTGFAANHLDRRKLLIATQSALGILALELGLLTVGGPEGNPLGKGVAGAGFEPAAFRL